jgi:hypothetical protein
VTGATVCVCTQHRRRPFSRFQSSRPHSAFTLPRFIAAFRAARFGRDGSALPQVGAFVSRRLRLNVFSSP